MNSVETTAMFKNMEASWHRSQRRYGTHDLRLPVRGTYLAKIITRLYRNGTYAHAMEKGAEAVRFDCNASVRRCGSAAYTQFPMEESVYALYGRTIVPEQQSVIWRMFDNIGPHTVYAIINITGAPAISLPVHLTEKCLPTGVQLMAAREQKALLLTVAEWFEREGQF